MQAHETFTHQTQVQALSDRLCSRPTQRQAATLLFQARVPTGKQNGQPAPLAATTPQP